MSLLEGGNGKNGILTAVFASVFLISVGYLTHDVFADNVIATIGVGPNPNNIAVNPATNMIYVREQANTAYIDVVNGSNNTWQSRIGTQSAGGGMAVNPSTNTIYFSNAFPGPYTVSVVNGSTNGIITQIPIPGEPGHIAVNPVTNTIYVVVYSSVFVINGSSNTVVKTIPYGKQAYEVAVNPNTNKIYLADGYSNTVTVIDGSTGNVTNDIQVGSVPEAIAVDKVTNMVYAANFGDDTVSVIDGSTNTVVDKISTGGSAPSGIAVNQVTNKIYIPLGNATLLVVNGTTDKITESLVTAGPTNGVGVNPNTNRIYTSDLQQTVQPFNGYLSVIDGSAPAPTPVLSAPSAPQNLQANSGIGQVMLTWQVPANQGSSAITNYNIYRGTSSGSESLLAANGTATSYTDKAVTQGQTYFYKVTAVNSVGESPRSNETNTIPSPPYNFEAHSMTGYVWLTWEVPTYQGSSITNYKIFKGTSSGNESLLATVGNGNSYTDKAVINGTTYYYRATAVNWFSESPPSAESSAIPSAFTNPSTPTNLTATAGNGQVTLSWGAPSSNGGAAITKYSIARGTSPGQESLLASVSGNTTTYTDANLAYGVTYYYYVVATNSAGYSSPISNEASATPSAPATVPSAPTNLGATAVSSSQINLSWNEPSSNGGSTITGYKIERMQGSSTAWTAIVSNTASTATTYSDTGLAASTIYTYRVSAINSVGTSSPSSTATDTTPNPVTVSAAPTSLTATGGNAQVTLSWASPSSNGGSAITNYTVYRGTLSGNETLLVHIGNVTSYSDTTVTNGQTYYYKVAAVNSVGTSPKSNEASATPSAPATVPSAPTGLTATGVSPKEINLSWNVPTSNGGSAITGYKIMVSTDGSSFTTLANGTNNTGTSYSTFGLHPHTTYYFEVFAINSVGTSASSNVASAATR